MSIDFQKFPGGDTPGPPFKLWDPKGELQRPSVPDLSPKNLATL